MTAYRQDRAHGGVVIIEERDEGGEAGWLLRPGTGHQHDALVSYERTLLTAVPTGDQPATAQSLAPSMPHGLADARDQIMHDAVSNGWLLQRDLRDSRHNRARMH